MVTRSRTREIVSYATAAPAMKSPAPIPTNRSRDVATYSMTRKIPKNRSALPRSFVSTRTSIAPPQITSSGPKSFSRPCARTSRFSRR